MKILITAVIAGIMIWLTSCERAERAPRAPAILESNGSAADVQAKVNQAQPGDTVTLPRGTFHWATQVNVNKGITIMGKTTIQGDHTTFHNGPPTVDDATILVYDMSGRFFDCAVTPSQTLRISGMTFTGGTGNASKGILSVGGSENPNTGLCHNVRIDHIHVTGNIQAGNNMEFYSDIMGVVDHCYFNDTRVAQKLQNRVDNGGFPYGDREWAIPAGHGGPDFMFWEDCYFENKAANLSANYGNDAGRGGKYIVRYCYLLNIELLCHGTGNATGRIRGGRAQEIYNNEYYWDHAIGNMDGVSSGKLIVHDNKLYGIKPTGGWNQQVYRLINKYGPSGAFAGWGGANGVNAWDVNDPKLYDSGTVTAWSYSGEGKLTDSSKNWTTNQWNGYSLRRPSDNATMLILSNTNNTLTARQWGDPCCIVNWSNGQQYEIRKVITPIDQGGAGKGDLISGDNPTPRWINQVVEGNYSWNNIHVPTGDHINLVASAPTVQLGRDYFNDTPMPGYTPYTYPHPMVTGGGTPAPTTPPVISPTPLPTAVPTATVTATPPPAGGVPAAPTNLIVAQSDPQNILLTWQDNSNNETGFNIQVNTNNSGWIAYETTAPNTTTRTLGMSPNKHYDFRVSSTNASGTSGFTNVAGIDFGAVTPGPTATATATTSPSPTPTAPPPTPTPQPTVTASPSPTVSPAPTPGEIILRPGESVLIRAPTPSP